MATTKSKKPGKRAAAAKRPGSASGPSATAPAALADSQQAAADRFVRDLQVRGEAAKPGSDGKLALSATHAITEETAGPVRVVQKVKRARFKTF